MASGGRAEKDGVRAAVTNGKDLPAELRSMPAGRYVVEPVDAVPPELTREEEDGLREAIAEIQRGEGETPEAVRRQIEALYQR
jgi:hypothetical protein